MNIKGYIEKINEELHDAEDYVCKAIECKAVHPDWAQKYAKVSEEELNHATINVQIFEDDLKNQPENVQDILSDTHDAVIDMYATQSARIKCMHQTYSEK